MNQELKMGNRTCLKEAVEKPRKFGGFLKILVGSAQWRRDPKCPSGQDKKGKPEDGSREQSTLFFVPLRASVRS